MVSIKEIVYTIIISFVLYQNTYGGLDIMQIIVQIERKLKIIF